jgi:hypothetical protein
MTATQEIEAAFAAPAPEPATALDEIEALLAEQEGAYTRHIHDYAMHLARTR